MKRKYNLSNIMKKAWELFNADLGTFSECLKQAWEDAKKFVEAAKDIAEEIHTWFGWRMLNKEVIHESKALFQIKVADAKTKNHTKILSYFGVSQVQDLVVE